MLKEWAKKVKPLYHRVLINVTEQPESYDGAEGPLHWTDERYGHIMELRQKALDAARKQWADFLFVSSIYSAFFLFRTYYFVLWHGCT